MSRKLASSEQAIYILHLMLDLFNVKLPSNSYPQDSSNQCSSSMGNYKAKGPGIHLCDFFAGSYHVQLKDKR